MSMQPVCFGIANIAQKCCEMMSSNEGLIPSKCWYELSPTLNIDSLATGAIGVGLGMGVFFSINFFLNHYYKLPPLTLHNNPILPPVNYNDENTFILLAKEGNLSQLKKYLINEADAEINASGKKGRTALLEACRAKKWTVVKYLIENGADINLAADNGLTPLHAVVLSENSQMVTYLISKGANPNAVDSDGQTPLHYACADGQSLQIVKELFVNTKYQADNSGNTPLLLACKGNMDNVGDIEIVRFLIENNADINIRNKEGQTLCHLAAKTNRADILKLLLTSNANPNLQDNEGNTPLHDAVLDNCSTALRTLLNDEKINPHIQNSKGESPLHLAIYQLHGNDNFAREMIQSKKFDLNLTISKNGEQELQGLAPIYLAIKFGHMNVLKCLVENGARLDIQGPQGNSPLLFAMQNNRTAETEFLIKTMNVSELQAPSKDGLTFVEHAATFFDERTLRLFAERKILFNFSEKNKNNLIFATMKNLHHFYNELGKKIPFIQIEQANEFMEELDKACASEKITTPVIQDLFNEIENHLKYFAKYSQNMAEGNTHSMSKYIPAFVQNFQWAQTEAFKQIYKKGLSLPHPPISRQILQALKEKPFSNIDEMFSLLSKFANIGLTFERERLERELGPLDRAVAADLRGTHLNHNIFNPTEPVTPQEDKKTEEEFGLRRRLNLPRYRTKYIETKEEVKK